MLTQKSFLILCCFFSLQTSASVRRDTAAGTPARKLSQDDWKIRAYKALEENRSNELESALEHLDDPTKNEVLRKIIKAQPGLMEVVLAKGIKPYLKGNDGITLNDFVVLNCDKERVQLFLNYILRPTEPSDDAHKE